MSIQIEGGCTYDYETHRIYHNDGAFSGGGCVHPRDIDEQALADAVRERYATAIKNALEIARANAAAEQKRRLDLERKRKIMLLSGTR